MKLTKSILIILGVILANSFWLSAKEIKPTLLVYGSGIEAFAAAVQAARSNVSTLWVLNADPTFHDQANNRVSISANDHLDGGIWKELLMKVASSDISSDSVAIAAKKDLSIRLFVNAMEAIVKDEKMLTVVRNSTVETLDRGKNTWRIALQNKKHYDVRAIVDASLNADLSSKTKEPLTVPAATQLKLTEELSADQVRTTVAIGALHGNRYSLTVRDILSQQTENIFFVRSFILDRRDVEAIPLRAHVGQAVGASVAYCAFFKTTAEKIDVRKLQTELIGFSARLLPWTNVSQEDPNFLSIQKAYLSTIFSDGNTNSEFIKRDSVYADHVRTIFNQYYSRSQLWFLDHKVTYFSLADLLSLIKILSFRGDEIDAQVQKDWNKKLSFEGDYNPDHVVSKYEFATLIDRYANPYAKTVTLDGNIVR